MSDEGGADIASEESGVVIHVLSERGVDVKLEAMMKDRR